MWFGPGNLTGVTGTWRTFRHTDRRAGWLKLTLIEGTDYPTKNSAQGGGINESSQVSIEAASIAAIQTEEGVMWLRSAHTSQSSVNTCT